MSDNEDGDAESPRYSNHESNGDVESPKTDKGSNGDGEDYQSHFKESEPYQEVKVMINMEIQHMLLINKDMHIKMQLGGNMGFQLITIKKA